MIDNILSHFGSFWPDSDLAAGVQTLASAFHRIKLGISIALTTDRIEIYPVDSVIHLLSTWSQKTAQLQSATKLLRHCPQIMVTLKNKTIP